jgi:hypothetical protein
MTRLSIEIVTVMLHDEKLVLGPVCGKMWLMRQRRIPGIGMTAAMAALVVTEHRCPVRSP